MARIRTEHSYEVNKLQSSNDELDEHRNSNDQSLNLELRNL